MFHRFGEHIQEWAISLSDFDMSHKTLRSLGIHTVRSSLADGLEFFIALRKPYYWVSWRDIDKASFLLNLCKWSFIVNSML